MSSTKVTVSFKGTVLKDGPSLISFPASIPSNEASLKYQIMVDPAQKRRVFFGENDVCTYVGKEKSVNDLDGSQYYLGVYNKRKRKLDVHNIETFYSMKLRFEGEGGIADPSTVTKNNKKVLVDRFSGSKRRRKQTKKLAAIITDDNVAAESHISRIVDSEAAKARTKDSQDQARMLRRREVLPPFKEDARLPHEVYPLDGLVVPKDTQCLKKEVARIKELVKTKRAVEAAISTKSKTKWPKYIAQRMQSLASSLTGKRLSKMALMLAHLGQYIRLHQGLRRSQLTKAKQLQTKTRIPKAMLGRLLHKFTTVASVNTKISVERTPVQTDKLLFHIFALCLHIDGFKSDPALIAQDVNLTPNKCQEYFRQMGCSISRKGGHGKICSLSAPLVFPKPKSRARSARR